MRPAGAAIRGDRVSINRPTRPRRFRSLLAALPLCLALAGCAGPSPTPPPLPDTPTPAATVIPSATPLPLTPTAAPAAAALRIGQPAPDFAFTLFHGAVELGASTLMLSELRGRPVALNFWARLCAPCWSEMPELQDFYEERGDRIQLLGIDVGQFTGLGSHKDAGKLLDSLGITYPAGYTDDAGVVRRYRIRAMPTTVIIGADGRVFRIWSGAINRQQLEAIIAELPPGAELPQGGERKS